MPVHGTANQIHQSRAYDQPQENSYQMRRKLEEWQDLERQRILALYEADNIALMQQNTIGQTKQGDR